MSATVSKVLTKIFGSRNERLLKRYHKVVDQINELEPKIQQMSDEQLHARTQPVETGEVRIRKEVHTEHKTMEVPVQREEVVIERHAPTGRAATSDVREGEEIRVPVMEEQVVVEKTPVVKEEVTVGKRVVQDTQRVAGEVRKEEVRVEREGDVDVRGGGTGTR